MKKIRAIQVPEKSRDHYINNVGCLRYIELNGLTEVSTAITPHESNIYLDNDLHEIVGYTVIENNKYILIRNK